MDRETREQLLRVRQLLEEAQARAHDASGIGRHIAVILLDGVCEALMKLAAGKLGISTKDHATFHEVQGRLAQHLASWNRDGWSDVESMHGARNLAQHRAVTPDGADVSRWSGAAQRFVRALVSAAFGVDLADVHLAGAVEEPDLREVLEQAEKALGEGEAFESLRLTVAAFDEVRAKWRAQRASAVDPVTLYRSPLGFTTRDGANQAIQQLIDYAEVTPFAQSLGEYVWFEARRDDLTREIAPTPDEARRALRFVLDWVLRWEAFALNYTGRRYLPEQARALPVTAAGEPPRIIEVLEVVRRVEPGIADVSDRVRYGIALQVANLPIEELDRFIGFFQTALTALPDGELDSTPRSEHGSLGRDGVVRFWGVEPTTSAETLIQRVQSALHAATGAHADLVQRKAAWAEIEPSILDAWRQGLQTVTFADEPLFDAFAIEGIVGEDGEPAYTVSATAPRLGEAEIGLLIWEVLNAAGVSIGTDISYDGDQWQFAHTVGADAAAAKAREVAALLERRIAQELRARATANAETSQFEAALKEAVEEAQARRSSHGAPPPSHHPERAA